MYTREYEAKRETVRRLLEQRGWRRIHGSKTLTKRFGGVNGIEYRYVLGDDGIYADFWDHDTTEWITEWFAYWDDVVIDRNENEVYATIKIT